MEKLHTSTLSIGQKIKQQSFTYKTCSNQYF